MRKEWALKSILVLLLLPLVLLCLLTPPKMTKKLGLIQTKNDDEFVANISSPLLASLCLSLMFERIPEGVTQRIINLFLLHVRKGEEREREKIIHHFYCL